MSPATELRSRLDVLNESIYEPEGVMSPSERDRRIAERDVVWDQLIEMGEEEET